MLTYTGHDAGSGINPNIPRQNHASPPRSQNSGCASAFGLAPLPVVRLPPPRVAVAAGLDELEKPRVGHVVALDREARHVDRPRRTLVVPAERHRGAIDAQRRAARGNADPLRRREGRRRCAADSPRAPSSGRTAGGATCSGASPGASPRARGWRRPPRPDRAADARARSMSARSSASMTSRSASSANARTASRDGHSAWALRAGERASVDSWGSIPRAKRRSRRASMLGPPRAFLTSVLKLKPGRCPS